MKLKEILDRDVYFYPVGSEFYVMFDGELTKVTIVCTRYDIDGDKSFPVVKLPNNEQIILSSKEPLYGTITDFEDGRPVALDCTKLDCFLPFNNGSYWIFEDGQPVEVKPYPEFILLYDKTDETMLDGKPMPESWYLTWEEAIQWNDYVVVETDGNKRVQKSKMKSLMLTAEQRELVDNLVQAINAVNDSGVILSFDDYGNLFAYNKTNVDEYGWGYECDSADSESLFPSQSNDCFYTYPLHLNITTANLQCFFYSAKQKCIEM